jgi:glycine/D-amino acid oxidase-like deaminating enzyme
MGPKVETVADDTTLPEQVDVVVIGGGIIGVSTALYLSEKGARVALCEKGHIAGEQSSRNWGWVRVTHRDMREFQLSIESLKLWREMDAALGIDTGFNQCGILYMTAEDSMMNNHRVWLEKARNLAGDAFDTREIDGRSVAELLPGAAKAFKGGLYTAGDGRAEPQKAAPAIANALRKRGVMCCTRHRNERGARQRGRYRARYDSLQ